MRSFDTADEWQKQSALLLQARPTTTRITTKYKLPNLEEPKYNKEKKRKRTTDGDEKDGASATKVPRASFKLKTYCPESGVCLTFKTDKAADVGRLIAGLGRLGRHMAALPQQAEDVPMDDAALADTKETNAGPTQDSKATAIDGKPQAGGGGGGGGKKKKKGKK